MSLISRNYCTITGKKDLIPLHTFSNFPVFMGCTQKPVNEDIFEDMTWCISPSSGIIQLNKLIPLNVLYPESHGAGCVGTLWKKHHTSFANFLSKYSPTAVFEIGGAHGILAKEYQKKYDIPWNILEPNPHPVEGCNAHFIKGFFNEDFTWDHPFDTVVHSHLFEHIYEPNIFMEHLEKFISSKKRLIFSVPNMQNMLEKKYTNCINFEHSIFLTEPYIEFLLTKYGFKVEAKEYFMNDHSIFYSCIRDVLVKPVELSIDLYYKNKQVFMEYISYYKDLIQVLNDKISNINSRIYIFGAHVFTQYLFSFGLNFKKITAILDNDPSKQGKRLYGSSLKVESPKVLKQVERPIVILRSGIYNQEIKEDIISNINSSTLFFE